MELARGIVSVPNARHASFVNGVTMTWTNLRKLGLSNEAIKVALEPLLQVMQTHV